MKKTVLAFDIGGSKVLTGLVAKNGDIIDSVFCELPKNYTANELEKLLISNGNKLLSENRSCQVSAIGSTIPGLADLDKGMWGNAVYSGIHDYPIVERLSTRFNLPTYIENDANACAWAEKIYGNCRDITDYLWITVSNGSGGGLILNGKLYNGVFGGAGEVGHLIVDDSLQAEVCPCGHNGCLESTAAGPGIVRRYKSIVPDAPPNIEARDILDLARAGKAEAVKIAKDTGTYIGKALAMCANILNLPCYVLGGGVMQNFDLFEPSIMNAFHSRSFTVPNQNVKIIQTGLGYEAGLMGAAAIAWYPTK